MEKHRPSGAHQRKTKRERDRTLQSMAGSIHKYVRTSLRLPTNDAEEVSARICTCEEGERQNEDCLQPSTSMPPDAHELFVDRPVDPLKSDACRGAGTQQLEDASQNFEASIFMHNTVGPVHQSDASQTRVLDDSQVEMVREEPQYVQPSSVQEGEDPVTSSKGTKAQALSNCRKTTDVLKDDMYSDIGTWAIPIPDDVRVSLVRRGSEPIQNKDGPFPGVTRELGRSKTFSRHLTKSWFYKTSADGSQVLRTWMVYSKSTNSIYCFCCKLFGEGKAAGACFVSGFNCWWKLNPRVAEHESSESHMSCYERWRTMDVSLKHDRTLDAAFQREKEAERTRWRHILHRLLDVVLFLAKMNLPLRGHRENMESDNRGNFLELVEFLSNYDAILKEHFTKVKAAIPSGGRGTSYLSPQTQNEFIQLLGRHVKSEIVKKIKEGKYYGILFDSTPDVSHVDQMCQVIRYVCINDGEVTVKESFLGFFPIEGKTAAEITKSILKHLEDDELDISFCRSQGYDNAAVMAGVHGGVQARIKQVNPKALFVPCANHSLNLCGVHSFESVNACVTFFGTLEAMYKFFSSSPQRWKLLKDAGVALTVKNLSQTRWSAHYEAVRAAGRSYELIITTLEALQDAKFNVETRRGALSLIAAVCDFSFLSFLYFWSEVLQEVNETQKYLQTAGISLQHCSLKLKSLRMFLEEQRIEVVEKAIAQATAKCEEMGIELQQRVRYRKKMSGERAGDAGLILTEQTRRAMFECLDRFHRELDTRSKAVEKVTLVFSIIEPVSLIFESVETLQTLTSSLTEIYDEFSGEEIVLEILRLRRHIKAAGNHLDVTRTWTAQQFLEFIAKWNFFESLPNLTVIFRLFLTICVSVASCERNFFKLKLIKTSLRSTMNDERLSNLAILTIEKEHVKNINFTTVINEFAEAKCRKKNF
ncbi:zinc finger MYM-type protein 1-like [Dermacentor albipictus]|uniref:zinc finger MYM-type protein 1-like n=1 Tax=Dermacentor albipictus TaxID=60249 RepID=UPI0038FBFD83